MNNIKQLSPVPIKIAGILPLYEMFKNMKTANILELNTLANNITSERRKSDNNAPAISGEELRTEFTKLSTSAEKQLSRYINELILRDFKLEESNSLTKPANA
jgi:hypothetical protein